MFEQNVSNANADLNIKWMAVAMSQFYKEGHKEIAYLVFLFEDGS